MAERACEFCGAADPDWLRWHDVSIADYVARVHQGKVGPTAKAVAYCSRDACVAAQEARYGPSGNAVALRRLTDEIGARGLDADDSEIRMLALMIQIDG